MSKRFWLSWEFAGAFTYQGPWWLAGNSVFQDETGQVFAKPFFCAAVIAESEEAAKDIIVKAHDHPSPIMVWRFCKETGWSPFSERFPRADWMEWPEP